MFVASVAVTCIALALAVDVLTSGADEATPVVPVASVERRAPAPEARVDTAFVAVRAAPLAGAPAVASRAQSSCGDFDFSFLNSACSTTWRKHPERLHRPATFVAGVTRATPSGSPVAMSPAAKPRTMATAAAPDRVPPPAKKLKPAVTAGLAAVMQ
jgi:hypothetical protein